MRCVFRLLSALAWAGFWEGEAAYRWDPWFIPYAGSSFTYPLYYPLHNRSLDINTARCIKPFDVYSHYLTGIQATQGWVWVRPLQGFSRYVPRKARIYELSSYITLRHYQGWIMFYYQEAVQALPGLDSVWMPSTLYFGIRCVRNPDRERSGRYILVSFN